jgi:hypothetical protein
LQQTNGGNVDGTLDGQIDCLIHKDLLDFGHHTLLELFRLKYPERESFNLGNETRKCLDGVQFPLPSSGTNRQPATLQRRLRVVQRCLSNSQRHTASSTTQTRKAYNNNNEQRQAKNTSVSSIETLPPRRSFDFFQIFVLKGRLERAHGLSRS